MSPLQIIATVFNLLYIFFAVKNKAICFLFGIIGCAVWAVEDFMNLNLVFDGFLQLFYVVISLYGAYNWLKGNDNQPTKITTLAWKDHIVIIAVGILISMLVAYLATLLFNTNLPYLDATTTGFSIVATVMLTRRIIDHWIYWWIINPMYVYIFIKMEAYLFAGVMVIFTIMAIIGYIDWKKEYNLEKA